MSAPLGEAFVDVGANTTKFASDLKRGVNAGLAQAQAQAQGFGASLRASLADASKSLTSFGRSTTTIGRRLTTSLTLPILGVGVASFKMSVDFETAMAKIEGLVGVAHDQVVAWGDDVKKLATTYGKSASEAADALYFITSSGVAASDTMGVLDASLKAAAIGLGDTATIADLLTSAMNAYGSEVLPASKATDILIASVREGKLEATDLAGAMSRVLPVASEMGVGFDQVGAAFAAMSLNGTDASEAATQIRQILVSLLKPTKEAEDTLTGLGLSAGGLREQLREKGLLSTLDTLVGAFGNNEEASAKVFGNIRALTGVMSLMGENSAGTAKIFDELTRTTNATDDAFAVIAKTAAFKVSRAFSDLKIAVMDLGAVLAPYVVKVAELVREFSAWFRDLDDGTKKFILLGGAILASLGPALIIIGALASSIGFLISPTTLIVAAIAALAAGLVYAYTQSKTFKDIVDAIAKAIGLYTKALVEVVQIIANMKWVVIAVTGVLVGMLAATLAETAAMWALNAAMLANPVGLAVVGTAALVGGTVALIRALGGGTSAMERFHKKMLETNNATLRWSEGGLLTAAENTQILKWRTEQLSIQLGILNTAYDKVFTTVKDFQPVIDARVALLQREKKEHYQVAEAVTTYGGATSSASDKVKELTDKIKALRESFGDEFKDALAKAGVVLGDAKQAFADFATSVANAITQSFSFSDAYSAGEESGSGFISALTDQATKVKNYGVLVDRLLAAGLKDPALQQVLSAGIDAGSAIATELLASADGVLRANQLAEEVAAIGDKVGLNAAGRFRQAGIDLATTFVTAIGEIISKATFKLSSVGLTPAQLKKLKNQFGVDIEFAFSSLPQLANGMLLAGRSGGYNVNVAEAGDEAVIPMSRPRRALELMEESGLANLARANGSGGMSPAVHIDNATFATPSDADLVAQRVMAGFKARG